MARKLVIGSILGGATLFAWGAVSWLVLPWHLMAVERFTDEALVADVIRANAPTRGTYLLPHPHAVRAEGEAATLEEGAYQERMRQGPVLFGAVQPRGARPDDPTLFLASFATQLVVALLLTWVFLQLGRPTLSNKLAVAAGLGLLAGFSCHVPNWNWWAFGSLFTTIAVLDLVIGLCLATLVIDRTTRR